MSPAHLAGKLLGIDIPGPQLDPETRRHLERYRFGGVCLFRKNVHSRSQLARLVADIREVLGEEVWVAVDQEGGSVLRTEGLPEAPSAMALGAAGDSALTEAVGAAVGRGLRSLGINWNFAPCLDVNTDPHNPVIGERSFGDNPEKVAALGLAWAKGLESAGVVATAKHFPGHGDTRLDSHLALPRVDKPLETLEQLELLPFRQAVEAGIPAIMTAHILYPALDAENPATLSKAILTGLLRERWGYEGLIITDSMLMRAIADHYPDGAAAVRSLQAGADLVLALGGWETKLRQAEAVAAAIGRGDISATRVEASLARLGRTARRFPGTPRPYLEHEQQADYALMGAAAARGITAYGPVTLPRPSDRILLLCPQSVTGQNVYESGADAQALSRHLSVHLPQLQTLAYPKDNPEAVAAELSSRASEADFLLLATPSRLPLSEGELRLGHRVFALGKPALHLALWNPYHVGTLGQPALLSYGFRPPALRALGRVLTGEPAPGRLPVRF